MFTEPLYSLNGIKLWLVGALSGKSIHLMFQNLLYSVGPISKGHFVCCVLCIRSALEFLWLTVASVYRLRIVAILVSRRSKALVLSGTIGPGLVVLMTASLRCPQAILIGSYGNCCTIWVIYSPVFPPGFCPNPWLLAAQCNLASAYHCCCQHEVTGKWLGLCCLRSQSCGGSVWEPT